MSLSNTDHTHRQHASGVVTSFDATSSSSASASASSSKPKPLFDSESEISINDHDDDADSIANVSVHTAQTVLPDVHEEDYKPGQETNYKLTTIEDMIDSYSNSHHNYRSTPHGSNGGHARSLTAVVISPTTSSLSRDETGTLGPTHNPPDVLDNDAYREALVQLRVFTATLGVADKVQNPARSPGLRASNAQWRRRTMSLSAMAETLALTTGINSTSGNGGGGGGGTRSGSNLRTTHVISPLAGDSIISEDSSVDHTDTTTSKHLLCAMDDAGNQPAATPNTAMNTRTEEEIDDEVESEVAAVTQTAATKTTATRRRSTAVSSSSTTATATTTGHTRTASTRSTSAMAPTTSSAARRIASNPTATSATTTSNNPRARPSSAASTARSTHAPMGHTRSATSTSLSRRASLASMRSSANSSPTTMSREPSVTARRDSVTTATTDRKRTGSTVSNINTATATDTAKTRRNSLDKRTRSTNSSISSITSNPTTTTRNSTRSASTSTIVPNRRTASNRASSNSTNVSNSNRPPTLGNYTVSSRTTAVSRGGIPSTRVRSSSNASSTTSNPATKTLVHSRGSSRASVTSPTPLPADHLDIELDLSSGSSYDYRTTGGGGMPSLPGSPVPTDVFPSDALNISSSNFLPSEIGDLPPSAVEHAFTTEEEDGCCCHRSDCPRWRVWLNSINARDEDLRVVAQIGQIMLENHELHAAQSQEKIHELHERCRQDEERIAELIRARDRLQRTAEDATRERDTLDEERVRSEQTLQAMEAEISRLRNELIRAHSAADDSETHAEESYKLQDELEAARDAQHKAESRLRRLKTRHENLNNSYDQLKREHQKVQSSHETQRQSISQLRDVNDKLRGELDKIVHKSSQDGGSPEQTKLLSVIGDITARNAELRSSLEEHQQMLNDSREEAAQLREQILCSTPTENRMSVYSDSVFLDEEVASAGGSRRGSIHSIATNATSSAPYPLQSTIALGEIDPLCLTPPVRSMSSQGYDSQRQRLSRASVDFPPAPVQATPNRSPDLRPVSDLHDISAYRSGALTDDDQGYYGRVHHRQQQQRLRRGARRWTELTALPPAVMITDTTSNNAASSQMCSHCQQRNELTSTHVSNGALSTTTTMATTTVDAGIQTDDTLMNTLNRRSVARPQPITVVADTRPRSQFSSNSQEGDDSSEEGSSYDEYEYNADGDDESMTERRNTLGNDTMTGTATSLNRRRRNYYSHRRRRRSSSNGNNSNNNSSSNNDNEDEDNEAQDNDNASRVKREKRSKQPANALRIHLPATSNQRQSSSTGVIDTITGFTPDDMVASPDSEHALHAPPLVGDTPQPSVVEFTPNGATLEPVRQPLLRLLSLGKSSTASTVVAWGSADEHTWTPQGSIYNSPAVSPSVSTRESLLPPMPDASLSSERNDSMMGRIRTSARTLWRRSTTSSVDFIRTEDSSPYDDATVSTTTTQTAAAAIMAAATASRENTHHHQQQQRRSRTRLNRRATTHIPSPLTSSPSHSLALSEQNAHAILSPPFMNHRVRTSISAYDLARSSSSPMEKDKLVDSMSNDVTSLPSSSSLSSYLPRNSGNRAITDSAATAAILSATSRPGGTYQRRRSHSVPRAKQDTPPLRQLHDRAMTLLQKLKNAEPRALNRQLRRAYDAEELVNRASSVLNNVLDDVHTLPDRFTWLLYEKSSATTDTTATTATATATANNNQEVPLSSNGHTVNDHNDRIKDLDGVPFVTTLGDFIAVVDLVARLLEEAVELQHTLNSMTLSYVQTVEERSREAVGADYIGDALHEVWQVRGSTGMASGEEDEAAIAAVAAAAVTLDGRGRAYNLARIRQSDRTRAHVYQTMPHRRGASTIRPGTWADWARQQFGGLRRQQMRQGNTISPQRGTISDDVTNGAYGRRRPRLITFQQQQQQQQQSASSSNTTTQLNEGTTSSSTSANTNANNNTSIPPAPILTARDVLLNRAEWLSSSDADANNTTSNNRAQEDGNHHSTTHARLRQRRETIAIAEQFASTQRTSWWWPQPLAAYFIGGSNSNDGNAAPNNSMNNSHVTT